VRLIELCSGAGGSRAGFEGAGWTNVLSTDSSESAIAIQKDAFGGACRVADVWDISPEELPPHDALFAGFPCQPFSSSGNRSGFGHKSGNVFEGILRLVAEGAPQVVMLENVFGLLHNKGGHTFSRVLGDLTQLGYEVDWLTVDLRWLGYPQTRPRVLIVAHKDPLGVGILNAGLFSADRLYDWAVGRVKDHLGLTMKQHSRGRVSEVERERRPQIGKAEVKGPMPFGSAGRVVRDEYVSFKVSKYRPRPLRQTLASIVAPNFSAADSIRSGRYWAYDGPTSLHLREDPVAHCVGTTLGGAPLFAVPQSRVSTPKDLADYLEFANWNRPEAEDLYAMRLRASRAVRLFGSHTERLETALENSPLGQTAQYVLVGNMLPPACAELLARVAEDRGDFTDLLGTR
jgi:DNA-cytosine methyltransferase